MPTGQYLEIGYFIKLDNGLLFVNNNVTIKFSGKTAKVLSGYNRV